MSGALAAGSVIAAVSLTPTAATADPGPQNSGDALKQMQELSKQAEILTEQVKSAQDDLTAKQAELNKAKADADQATKVAAEARGQKAQFQGQVDKLADASFQGARFNQLSALLVSQSPQDFLDRASALDVIASGNRASIEKLSAVVAQASDAEKKAQDATARAQKAADDATKLRDDIAQRQQAMQKQIAQVKAQYDKLNQADKSNLGKQGDMGDFPAPPGIAGQAMAAALGKRGSAYVWGADGPNTFDCSGLVLWSYKQAGYSGLPHSAAAQSRMGQPVSRDELQPGDLVFFGSPAHHVGIYVGGGQMVNAPDFGIPVRVQPLGHDYSGGRRISG